MPIGITEDHVALQDSVRGWVERHCPPSVPRAGLDEPQESRPPFWAALAEQGWLSLAVPEDEGGSGVGVGEVVVVLEELGYAGAPGPALATLLTIEVVRASTNRDARAALLPDLAAGTRVGAVVGHVASTLRGTRTDGGLVVQGAGTPVLGAHQADLLVAPVDVAKDDGGSEEVWVALEVGPGVTVRELPSVDLTRRVGAVEVDVMLDAAHVLSGVTGAHVADASAA
jgi:alkylation response protein AidB-like acyl-CoA dehydrogenase